MGCLSQFKRITSTIKKRQMAGILMLALSTLFSSAAYSGLQLGTDIDITSEDFENNTQVEYVEVLSYSEDEWGDPEYIESALIATSPYYLKNGFSVELDLERKICLVPLEQRLIIQGHGFLLAKISQQKNKTGCWFSSDLFDDDFLVTEDKLRFLVDSEGTLSFYQNEQLVAASERKLDLEIFEIAYPSTQFDFGNLSAFRFTAPSIYLSDSVSEYVGESLFHDFYMHPEGLGVKHSASEQFTHKLWTLDYTDADLSPFYFSQYFTTHYNTEFVFHENSNNLSISEQLQEIWAAEDGVFEKIFVIRSCLEDMCPAADAIDIDGFYDIEKPTYAELTQWDALKVEQLEQNSFEFTIPTLIDDLLTTQFAQTVELLMQEASTLQEHSLTTVNVADSFPDWDGLFNQTVALTLYSEEPVRFYLRVCNAVNCIDTSLSDAFDATATDTDGDGIPDHEDADIDNDGYPNEVDLFPLDATEWSDLDGDGVGDNSDPDIDGDGVVNNSDAFPLDVNEWIDTDSDGIGNNSDPDMDNDGYLKEEDLFPLDATEWSDLDGDGVGDNSDPDIDGDGLANELDPEPFEYNYNTRQDDSDFDGLSDDLELLIGFNAEVSNDLKQDSDYDGYSDLIESLVGSAIDDNNETPANLGYTESFEAETPVLMNLNQAEQLDSTGSVHGELSYWLETDNTGEEQNYEIQYHGHIGSGYVIFTTYSDTFDEALDAKLGVYNTHWNYDNDAQQYRVHLGDGVTLFFLPVRNDSSKTTRLKIKLTFSQPTAVDMFYFPNGEACRIAGRNPGMPDFNCDGKADPVMQRASTAESWLYKDTDTILNDGNTITNADNALLLSHGDFDGDGISDAVLRTNDMQWRIDYSSYGKEDTVRFGLDVNDIPVIGDYDGDGISDIAVRRPRTGMWYIKRSSDNEIGRIKFGRFHDDIPVPADYDGDGITDVAIRRPSNYTWYIRQSTTGETRRVTFGKQPGDIAVPADYDGDGKADIAIRRPYLAEWIVLQSSDGQIVKTRFGSRENDLPVPADYDGDGKADFAIKRIENGMWYILRSSDAEIQHFHFSTGRYDIPLNAPPLLKWQIANGDYSFIDN